MNAGIKLAAVYVAGAILVAGCGQSNSGSAGVSPSQSAAAAKPVAPKEASIKVKGLYIGMDIQSVPALMKENFAGKKNFAGMDWAISDVTKVDASARDLRVLVIDQGNLYVSIGSTAGGIVIATPDGKVFAIELSSLIVNDLFNAADMDASAFVKQFISAYDIPEMKVSDNLQSWTYTSPDGVKVTIDTQKNVSLEKVASAQDRKQSFN